MTGLELKKIRIDLGLKQSELAEKLDISRVWVGQLERDEKLIKATTELAVYCLAYEANIRHIGERQQTTIFD